MAKHIDTGLGTDTGPAMQALPAGDLSLASPPAHSFSASVSGGPYYMTLTDGDDWYAVNGGFLGETFTIYGLGGNDVINGYFRTNDHLYGGDGSDYLNGGGGGSDYLDGGAGDDVLFAYDGDDRLVGGDGNDWLFGGDGFNWLYGDAGNDVLLGGAGTDILSGGEGNDWLIGGAGVNLLDGGAGDDLLSAGAGTSWLFGGDGFDTVDYGSASTGVIVNLVDMSSNTGVAAGHFYSSVERFFLSAYGDTFVGTAGGVTVSGMGGGDHLTGGSGNDILDGGADNDTLIGGDGGDVLLGGNGNDVLNGGVGNDYLDGGAGADTLAGGDGYDVASYGDATAGVSIDLGKASSTWTGDAQGDVLTSIEEIDLTDFADSFRGDANANIVDGGYGDDQINGLAGDDQLTGGVGNDSIAGGDGNDLVIGDGFRGAGDDYLQGNAGNDVLIGGRGNDKLVGGTGNDTLSGGVGGDTLIGNEGADVFQFAAIEESQIAVVGGAKQQDQILDFTQGEDKIDLSGIDANSGLAGDQAFTFLADPASHTGDWSGLVWQTTAANGIATINVSIDADPAAKMQIYMSHAYHFTASDFIL